MNHAPLDLFCTNVNSIHSLISILESRTNIALWRGVGLSFLRARPGIDATVVNPTLRPMEESSSRWGISTYRLLAF